MRIVLLAVAAVCIGVLSAACSQPPARPAAPPPPPAASTDSAADKVFDHRAMEESVRTLLAHDYRLVGVDQVSCPREQGVTEGATFDCQATVSGKPARVAITVTDADGEYQVAMPRESETR